MKTISSSALISTEAKAQAAIERLKDQPGFKDSPDEFKIYQCTLDDTSWREGFITIAEAMEPKDLKIAKRTQFRRARPHRKL